MLRPLLCGHGCWHKHTQDKYCGLWISDCGFEPSKFNPQSAIRNRQLVHDFHVPFATAGTNVSTPGAGKSLVRPFSALMYAVIRAFTNCQPSSDVSAARCLWRN